MDFETSQESFSGSEHDETLRLPRLMTHCIIINLQKNYRNQIKLENADETPWESNELNQGFKKEITS